MRLGKNRKHDSALRRIEGGKDEPWKTGNSKIEYFLKTRAMSHLDYVSIANPSLQIPNKAENEPNLNCGDFFWLL
jgi:hypothetical protein